MKNALVALATLIVCIFVTRVAAADQTFYIKGTSCFPDPTNPTPMSYSQDNWGPYVPSGTNQGLLHCPVMLPTPTTSYTRYDLTVIGYDRNPSISMSCTILANRYDGTNYTYAGVSFAGALNSNVQSLATTLPLTAGLGQYWVEISCYLPPPASGQVSYLTGVQLVVHGS
jgi:hypothetical protein